MICEPSASNPCSSLCCPCAQVHAKCHKGRVATPQEDFAMGAVAGAAAAAATTPLDVIKTNMMCNAASRPSMAAAIRHVSCCINFSLAQGVVHQHS